MNSVIPRKELPPAYQIISSIRSTQTRVNLTEHIEEILSLLSFLRNREAPQSLRNLIKRFFTYLDNTCSSKEKLERRVLWLTRYAEQIIDRLIFYKDGDIKTSLEGMLPHHTSLGDRIQELIEAVDQYNRIDHRVSCDEWLSLLDRVYFLANYTDMFDHDIIHFKTAKLLKDITESIDRHRVTGTLYTDGLHHNFFRELEGIGHDLYRFILRHD